MTSIQHQVGEDGEFTLQVNAMVLGGPIIDGILLPKIVPVLCSQGQGQAIEKAFPRLYFAAPPFSPVIVVTDRKRGGGRDGFLIEGEAVVINLSFQTEVVPKLVLKLQLGVTSIIQRQVPGIVEAQRRS